MTPTPGTPKDAWPEDGLETVDRCPICGARSGIVLHENLRDRVFNCAPGDWIMRHCAECSAAYLDPRPTAQTIQLAYRDYFTHNDVLEFKSLGLFPKIRRLLANGYRNRKFGTRDRPESFLGALLMPLMPDVKEMVDAGMRHLPPVSQGGRLLDVGCGNGAFLLRARSAGWQTVGVDFDPKAVQVAQKLELEVRLGGLEILNPAFERFDVITMSHVIEHVHDPVGILEACARLLDPGGVLWLETPNICSIGHAEYGRNWRGLEPPRHLVIFSPEALNLALKAAGFADIRLLPYRPLCLEMFRASEAIAEGVDPYSGDGPLVRADRVAAAEKLARKNPGLREFITVQARK